MQLAGGHTAKLLRGQRRDALKRVVSTDRAASHLIDIFQPIGDMLEGLEIGHIVDDDDALVVGEH